MNIFKRFLIWGLAIIITIGTSGCINLSQSGETIILNHLKEKYNGQEFISIYMSGSSNFGGDPVLYCYPKGGDPEADRVRATMSTNENGEREFDDTYFNIIIREDVEAEVLAALSDMNLPMRAYMLSISSYRDNMFDGTKTYADFKQWIIDNNKEEDYRLGVTIAVSMDDVGDFKKEEYANQMFDTLEKDDYCVSITVYFYPSKAFEKVDRLNVSELSDYYDEAVRFWKLVN